MPEINKTALFDIKDILSRMGIGEKQWVAELGCGNFGFFVFPLARLIGKYGKVYAVDILKPTLQEINRKAKMENLSQVVTVWSNLEIFRATNIPVSSLDNAFLINILHQSNKREEIIREATRLLKRGGQLLIIEWKSTDVPFGPKSKHRVKIEDIKNIITRLGLSIKNNFEAGPYHYGLILKKL